MIETQWDPYFYKRFLGFESILPLWQPLAPSFLQDWPNITDYNRMTSNFPMTFIPQAEKMRYLWEVFYQRHVPTRPANWHDFFNNLTWLHFPRLKWAIVQATCNETPALTEKKRTPKQNFLAHFDECGIVLCSDAPLLFNYIKHFEWKRLFSERAAFLAHCYPVMIGHGLLEKALKPYLGMTAKALFLEVSSDFFADPIEEKLKHVDEQIAHLLSSSACPRCPKWLAPFPILGWPGWDANNTQASFYDNTGYFRPRRSASR